MKPYTLLITLILGFWLFACSGNDLQVSDQERAATSPITKAMTSAGDRTEEFDFGVTESDVRAYIARQKNSSEIRSIDPVQRDGDTLLYVVNYPDGWSVFSADKHLPPVLAEGESGSFDLKKINNPGVLEWLEQIFNMTQRIRQEKDFASSNENTDLWTGFTRKSKPNPSKSEYTWTKVLVSSVQEHIDTVAAGPFLNTEWGQSNPWNMRLSYYNNNNLLYRFPTGCVTVAISQLLYWFHSNIGSPSGLYHDVAISSWTSCYNPVGEPYFTSNVTRSNFTNSSPRWAQMLQKYTDYLPSSPSSVVNASYVADLMADVGNRICTQYTQSESSSSIYNAQTGLSYFELTADLQDYSDTLAYDEIVLNQRPFLIQGFSQGLGGHAWIIDGLDQYRIKTTNTYMWYMGYLPGTVPDGEPATVEEARAAALAAGYEKPEEMMTTYEYYYTEPERKYHMNWGWDGNLNDYYNQ